ncbi:hypothetical protein MMC13_006610 [Lambiella insularis]|nr:hypothetical protein [Lambiella insularis]
MSGLVGYGSSDEEDADGEVRPVKTSNSSHDTRQPSEQAHGSESNPHTNALLEEARNGSHKMTLNVEGRLEGPSLGPSASRPDTELLSAPQSPYTANRALIRDLTLPTIPNLDIPNSPPGSPPPGMDQKFEHFLELKRQGVHFNEKLARSSALKNPSLLKKLMDFAGIDESEQYSTTLPPSIWDPTGFPPSAFKEELNKSQEEVHKRREEERLKARRESVDFVSASVSGQSSRAGTPASSGVSKGLRGSAAERSLEAIPVEEAQGLMIGTVGGRQDLDLQQGESDPDLLRINSKKFNHHGNVDSSNPNDSDLPLLGK